MAIRGSENPVNELMQVFLQNQNDPELAAQALIIHLREKGHTDESIQTYIQKIQ